ncbi:MAG TPA: tetratricopeptide repeat protein [Phycisphaerae bacterium]|jgi:tetratricopeptide (TPR) repeat protein|nr:tetratricopeptide repeat protein [Phycisphaerae bacterium]
MTDNANNAVSDPEEGPGKGKVYFDRAATVAATGNFDYAIDLYVQGLYREPLNMDQHKQLREVAFHRKVNGGKPQGGLFGAKTPYKGKVPKEAMLNAEYLLAKDVGNITHMMQMVRNAAGASLGEVVSWMGPIAQEANRTSKSPKKDLYLELAELFAKVNDFDKAAQAAELARMMDPKDGKLDALVKDYAAQATMVRGKFDQGGDFKQSIKDMETTKKLLEEENLGKSTDYKRKAIEEAKEAYEKNPTEMQVIVKYAKTLADMDDEAHENEAIEVLRKAFAATKVYRFKSSIGDIRMKQFRRNASMLKEAVYAHADDEHLKQELEQLQKDRLAFELGEYRERAEHFPTDLVVRYEYGRRLYDSGMYDEAIGALQEAQNNPKYRVDSLYLLGRAFMSQKMLPEALDTLKRAIEEYENAMAGDAKSKAIHYWYARALEESGKIKGAVDVYSQIVRWDYQYLDTRKRLADLRARLEAAGT